MASSCLSTAAAQLQLQLQLHLASSPVFPRPARAHHRLVAAHAVAVPVHRRRALAVTASASLEEAGATVVEEVLEEVAERGREVQLQEQDEVHQEEGAAVGASSDDSGPSVAATTTTTNTKLYFGNLPYNCDSAQLAGIVQEYASPEMVEVRGAVSDQIRRLFLLARTN